MFSIKIQYKVASPRCCWHSCKRRGMGCIFGSILLYNRLSFCCFHIWRIGIIRCCEYCTGHVLPAHKPSKSTVMIQLIVCWVTSGSHIVFSCTACGHVFWTICGPQSLWVFEWVPLSMSVSKEWKWRFASDLEVERTCFVMWMASE